MKTWHEGRMRWVLFALLLAAATVGHKAQAATVTYVGAEVSSGSEGWGTEWNTGTKKDFRSTDSNTKLFTLPGKPNAYGSDGYIMFGQLDAFALQEATGYYQGTIYTGTRSSDSFNNPAPGIASVTVLGWNGSESAGMPATPGEWRISGGGSSALDDASRGIGVSVADQVNGMLWYMWNPGQTTHDFIRITLDGSPSVKTIRIGVLTDRGDGQKPGSIGLNGVWQTRLGVNNYGMPDWYFFDIANAAAGDIVTISITPYEEGRWGTDLRGLVFDVETVPKDPPVSTATGATPLPAPFTSGQTPKGDFCVAPAGNDAHPGTADRPFATLARARDAVRKLLVGGPRDVTVLLRGGRYELTDTLVFTPEDGAAEGRTVTYAAWPGETPVVSGGREINGWRKETGNRWTAELPDVKARTWFFRQLFVDGERATRARWPNYPDLLRAQTVSEDVRTITIDTAPPGNLAGQDAEIVVFQNWSISRALVTASEGAKLTTASSVGWIWMGLGEGDDYLRSLMATSPGKPLFLEHAREFLDQPGEWFLDRKTGVITYVATPDQDLTKRRVTASRLERVLAIEGTREKPVRGLHFTGIQFEGAEFPLPAFGYSEIQAGHFGTSSKEPTHVQPAALECLYAENCRFERIRISQCGGAGIAFGPGCKKNAVVGCGIEDLGGNGVMIGWRGKGELQNQTPDVEHARWLAADWKDATDAPQGNVVENNLIQRCGAVSHGSVGVFVAFSGDTRVAHNLIRDMPYTGISIGFRWNPTPTTQKNCIVELNHIHDVMQMLADGGGIYSLGFQPGTVLRGNLIHEVHRSRFAHGGAPNNGFFIDQGSKGFLFEANTVFATSGEPVRFNESKQGWHTWKDNALGYEPQAASYQKGKVGQALSCAGAGDRVEVPHAAVLEPEQLTLSAWVFLEKHTSGEDARRWLVNKNGNELDRGHYALIISGKDVGAYLNTSGGRENCFEAVSTSTPLTLNRWHHLAATYDGRDLKVYVDGALVASKAVNRKRLVGDRPLVIGQRQDGFGNSQFVGLLDEVRVYGRALSEAELKAMAQDPIKTPTDGVAGSWALDEMQKDDSPAAKLAAQAGLQQPYRTELLGADGKE